MRPDSLREETNVAAADKFQFFTCCNDGTRPVIFKIERIDIPENDGKREWLAKQNFQTVLKTLIQSNR